MLIDKKLFSAELYKICKSALLEDAAENDITSQAIIKNNSQISFQINARQDLILCGSNAIKFCFKHLQEKSKFKNSFLEIKINARDGSIIKSGDSIAEGLGDAKLIFAAERVILNLIQHLSGISTATDKFVKNLNNKNINILDTRKTLPNLRILQKHAVTTGGGANHRFNLSDMILIKDNHIAAAGSVSKALELAKKTQGKIAQKKIAQRKIEIECDNFKQVVEAIESSPDIIMLDNMSVAEIKKCSSVIRKKSKKIKIEISGGVNLSNIKNFSKLDIDFISVGSLTHSVIAVDIGLDII